MTFSIALLAGDSLLDKPRQVVTWLWVKGERLETWGEPDSPAGFLWQGTPHSIVEVCNRWRVHTRWWEPGEAVWREVLKVTTDNGYLCLIYRDLVSGGWFLSRIYD